MLHLLVAALIFATAVPTVVVFADLWMPDHTGVFLSDRGVTGAGLLARPEGHEVHADWLRPIGATLALIGMMSVVSVHQVGLRLLSTVSNGFQKGPAHC